MAAEEQKHSSIKEEVKVLDKNYQKTKKEYEVCICVVGFSNGHTLIRIRDEACREGNECDQQ
jgi:hypothetical protein